MPLLYRLLARCVGLFVLAIVLKAGMAQAMIEEVPFVTTPDNVTKAMLDLAGVGPDDFIIDLGSGDGRIVNAAAAHFGARGLGVELVPELVERSLASARKAGVADRVEFRVQDLFQTDLSRATVITLYLLPQVNLELRPRLLELRPGTRIVSHDWDMGDWLPDETRVVDAPDKKIGREKISRLHRWVIPAQVDGQWCAAVAKGITRLRFSQSFQLFSGVLEEQGTHHALSGRIEGEWLHALQPAGTALRARVQGARLTITEATGPQLPAKGTVFERC